MSLADELRAAIEETIGDAAEEGNPPGDLLIRIAALLARVRALEARVEKLERERAELDPLRKARFPPLSWDY